MTPLDTVVTTLDVTNATVPQIAQGSMVTDEDGARRHRRVVDVHLVARKLLDVQQQQGSAAVQLIEAAAQTMAGSRPQSVASTSPAPQASVTARPPQRPPKV